MCVQSLTNAVHINFTVQGSAGEVDLPWSHQCLSPGQKDDNAIHIPTFKALIDLIVYPTVWAAQLLIIVMFLSVWNAGSNAEDEESGSSSAPKW